MSSVDLQTVVIACPNCGTRYQVPYATIGVAGREVQCAQCSQPWHATAERPPAERTLALPGSDLAFSVDDDIMFSPGEENLLDAAFEAEADTVAPHYAPPVPRSNEHERTLAEIKAAIMPRQSSEPASPAPMDPALLSRARRAFERRQARMSQRLPIAQVRRTARLAAFVLLSAILLLGFAMRTDLVRWFPQLAGVYAAIGLPVNVVGLEFADSRTLTSYRDGQPLMLITARIRSVASDIVTVPPVLVTLLDDAGTSLYEWTAQPPVARMAPGATQEFSSEISTPPASATRVRLSFAPLRTAPSLPAGTL